eukprot:1142296-Pelagomonas_calceolata.AAC.3
MVEKYPPGPTHSSLQESMAELDDLQDPHKMKQSKPAMTPDFVQVPDRRTTPLICCNDKGCSPISRPIADGCLSYHQRSSAVDLHENASALQAWTHKFTP